MGEFPVGAFPVGPIEDTVLALAAPEEVGPVGGPVEEPPPLGFVEAGVVVTRW